MAAIGKERELRPHWRAMYSHASPIVLSVSITPYLDEFDADPETKRVPFAVFKGAAKAFVMKFLRPAVKRGEFTMWVDRQMRGGTKWDDEIEANLRPWTFSFCSCPPVRWASTT
jgi:hypothetical protein